MFTVFLLLFHFCIWIAHTDPLLLAPASIVQQRFIVCVAAMGASVSALYRSNFYLLFSPYTFWSRPPDPPTSVGEFLWQGYEEKALPQNLHVTNFNVLQPSYFLINYFK